MLTGTCLNCGTAYRGWALSEKRHQTCLECGSLIKVAGYDKAEMRDSVWRKRVVMEKRPSVDE